MGEMKETAGGKTIKVGPVLSWALYDLANQFFALIMVSLYFPRWVSVEKGVPEVFYSLSYALSMLLVAVSAPVLGAVADAQKRHRRFLVLFTLLSAGFTSGIGLLKSVPMALVFFAVANLGCQEAIVFYNSLMVKVAPPGKEGFVSGVGRVFGYTGAVLAIYLTKPVILNMGYGLTFVLTGAFFLIFALPCMVSLGESGNSSAAATGPGNILKAFRGVRRSFLEMLGIRGFPDLLKAAFSGLCAVNTVILFMFVYADKVFGLGETKLIDLVAFSTLFAIAGSAVSGVVSDRLGHRRSLMGVFVLWALCILAGGLLEARFVWLIGGLAGFSLGSTWVVLRAFVIELVPEGRIGEAFGLFNLVIYISSIVGPVFWGLILLYLYRFGKWGYRLSFLSLLVFIVAGTVFLAAMGRKEGVDSIAAGHYNG